MTVVNPYGAETATNSAVKNFSNRRQFTAANFITEKQRSNPYGADPHGANRTAQAAALLSVRMNFFAT